MKTLLCLLVTSSSLFLLSCKTESTIYPLSASDKELLFYSIGDVIHLQKHKDSLSHAVDTFNLVVKNKEFSRKGRRECFTADPLNKRGSELMEYGTITFAPQKNTSDYEYARFSIIAGKSKALYEFEISLDKKEYHIQVDSYEELVACEIKGRIYYDVCVFSNGDTKFYYSKTKGILAIGDFMIL